MVKDWKRVRMGVGKAVMGGECLTRAEGSRLGDVGGCCALGLLVL